MIGDLVNFKIIVLGSQGVGKSTMIMRYIKGQYAENYNVTVGVQYATKIVPIDTGEKVRLQIWDTAGQELFRALVRSFYKGISAVFFVYAIDHAPSFQQLKAWSQQLKENAHEEEPEPIMKSNVKFQLNKPQHFLDRFRELYSWRPAPRQVKMQNQYSKIYKVIFKSIRNFIQKIYVQYLLQKFSEAKRRLSYWSKRIEIHQRSIDNSKRSNFKGGYDESPQQKKML